MAAPRIVKVFLEDSLLSSARAGRHNFIGLMQSVLTASGYEVQFLSEDAADADDDGLTLVHMKAPVGRRGLTFRRVYHYPFWQIEVTDRRWAWDVARASFDPKEVPRDEARRFQRFWRKRLYGVEDATPALDGPVYAPLQGHLMRQRSFQSMSPIAMLETTLRLETSREIAVTLHPKEDYGRADHAALAALVERHPRLRIESGTPADHLPRCAYVVTQNSGVAFDGFLFDRPAVLFAKIDFHHIAQNVTRMAPEDAFARVLRDRPDFAGYLHWFWQRKSINAGRPEAAEKIRTRFSELGWPM